MWLSHPGNFSVVPAEKRDSDILLCCSTIVSFGLHSRSKLVMRVVRHRDQDERESDGAGHWNTMYPNFLRAFEIRVEENVRTEIGSITSPREATRQGSNIAKNSR